MKFTTSVNVDISGLSDIEKKLGGNELGNFASATTHKHYFESMPYNTGNFSKDITFSPWEYTHNVNYAREVYNTNRNYRRDIHIFSQSHYIEGFESVAMPKIEKELQNYIATKVLR